MDRVVYIRDILNLLHYKYGIYAECEIDNNLYKILDIIGICVIELNNGLVYNSGKEDAYIYLKDLEQVVISISSQLREVGVTKDKIIKEIREIVI